MGGGRSWVANLGTSAWNLLLWLVCCSGLGRYRSSSGMMRGVFLMAGDWEIVLAKISLYASIDFAEASILGRWSTAGTRFVGEAKSDPTKAERGPPECCETKEGFLLKLFRDDLLLSSGTGPSKAPFVLDLPNPNLEAVPARGSFGSVGGPVLDEGSLIPGRGCTVCCDLPVTGCPLLKSA